jgi:hypothetical protein
LATHEPIFFEEESLIVRNVMLDKYSKKLIFERIHSKNKNVQGKSNSELDLNRVPPSRIEHIHEVTGQALKVSVDEMENEMQF